jgi:hypothetical protein
MQGATYGLTPPEPRGSPSSGEPLCGWEGTAFPAISRLLINSLRALDFGMVTRMQSTRRTSEGQLTTEDTNLSGSAASFGGAAFLLGRACCSRLPAIVQGLRSLFGRPMQEAGPCSRSGSPSHPLGSGRMPVSPGTLRRWSPSLLVKVGLCWDSFSQRRLSCAVGE